MWVDTIITIAAVLGAISAIIATIIKVRNFIKKIVAKFENAIASVDELKIHLHENYMSLLRLTIMSSEMPIGERINAGYKYLENHGNGEIKQFLKNEFDITETVDNAKHYKKEV